MKETEGKEESGSDVRKERGNKGKKGREVKK